MDVQINNIQQFKISQHVFAICGNVHASVSDPEPTPGTLVTTFVQSFDDLETYRMQVYSGFLLILTILMFQQTDQHYMRVALQQK